MTKAEKKIWNVFKNTTIGAVGGAIFGVATTPISIGMCLTAPVSFPLVGAATGALHAPANHKGISILIGAAIGTSMIPSAVVGLALSPFNAVQFGVAGAVVGGIVGLVENEKEDK